MSSLHNTIFSLYQQRGSGTAFKLQLEAGGYRKVSFADARLLSLKLSAYLRSKGVVAGDKVMIVSENAPEWPVAALAVLNLRAVLVPVAAIGSNFEIENVFRAAAPKFCIYSQEISGARHLGELLKAENTGSICWRTQDDDPIGRWVESQGPDQVDQSSGDNDPALLIFTSGTTGNPKGVPITHGNILSNARAVVGTLSVSEYDRVVSVLPLSHMLEFTGGYVLTSLIGAEVTYIKSLKPEDLIQALRDSKATVLIAVPLLFEVISRNLQAKLNNLPGPLKRMFSLFSVWTMSFPALGKVLFYPIHAKLGGSIRFLVAGGARLQPQTFDYFRGLGITILQGYGLTETSPVLTFTTMETAAPDHVGAPVPGVEIGIFDSSGNRLDNGQEGEIWAKGPSVFSGYLNSEQNMETFSNGWFRTGDLGTLDASNLLRITGRKKDIIVTAAGKNVYPDEIEGLVMASGSFLEVAAMGINDSSGHEKIVLVVVPDKTRFLGLAQAEVSRECEKLALESTKSLAEYKWPQRVEVLFEDLPKTSTRKVKKHELKKRLERLKENSTTAPAEGGEALNLKNALELAIANGISEITKVEPANIRLEHSLSKDLGLDSLTFVELVGEVEKKFNARIEGVDFSAIVTVKDLVSALQFTSMDKTGASIFNKVFFADFRPIENQGFIWAVVRGAFNRLVRVLLRYRYDIEVEGVENLEGDGPFIFTPNHSSHFDLLSIAGSIPARMIHRTFAVAAKDYFFNGTLKSLGARAFVNAIPFDRKGRVNESMQACREAIDQGNSLVIFPEGTRSPNGSVQEFKSGVGQLLAGHPEVKAVPVYIEGAYQIMPKGASLPGSGKLRVRYGRPISFRDMSSEAESLKRISERLRAEVLDLVYGRLN